MTKLFGTDGVRGIANAEPMTASTALAIGMAAGHVLCTAAGHRTVVIGKDTRLSGYLIESALTAGLAAVGIDVVLLGPLPTPALARLTHSLRADMGVMITASHNPYQDNGIKLFGPSGYKLTDDQEREIEALVAAGTEKLLAAPDKIGHVRRLDDGGGRYIETVKGTFPVGKRLDGLRLVIDCANGAAYKVAPRIFWELGAEVIALNVEPNGTNINKDCGALHPEVMADVMVREKAHLGIALDGDADRLILCDEKGRIVDGDQILALIASSWQRRGLLKGDTVVATVMSNMGLESYLKDLGLVLERTQVGDRHVVERMRAGSFNLGGEQSGHIVMHDYATTGDGILSALQVLTSMAHNHLPASELLSLFTPYPQRLENIRLERVRPDDVLNNPAVTAALSTLSTDLGDKGRLLVRKSGTEPLIRVMVEAQTSTLVDEMVKRALETLHPHCG